MNTRLNTIFYVALAVSFILWLLPPEYNMAVYTPSYLGYFLLVVCLPVTLVTFVWVGILDLKSGIRGRLAIRTIVFLLILLISAVYRCYMAHA